MTVISPTYPNQWSGTDEGISPRRERDGAAPPPGFAITMQVDPAERIQRRDHTRELQPHRQSGEHNDDLESPPAASGAALNPYDDNLTYLTSLPEDRRAVLRLISCGRLIAGYQPGCQPADD